MGGIASGMTPASPGNFALRLDIAVAAGGTDKLRPGTDADQRSILTMQQGASLLGIEHQLRLARDGGAKIRFRFLFWRRSALNRQTGIGPGLPAAVEQAHILHAGVEHNLRHAGGGIHVATVQNYRGVMANAVFCQHRFKLRVGHFIP